MESRKVYAVIGGIDYEGEDFSTLRLFDCFSTATAYCEHLGEQMDYALMDTREVCMESALMDTREISMDSALMDTRFATA